MLTLADRPNYHVGSFRYRLENFWANYQEHHKYLTLGGLLQVVKQEKLWEKWGHKTFSMYCRKELHIVPVYHENLFICAYLRVKSLGVSPEIMEVIERTFSMKRVLAMSKYARNEKTLLGMLGNKQLTTMEVAERFILPDTGKKRYTENVDLPRGQYEVLRITKNAAKKRFHLSEKDTLAAMSVFMLLAIYPKVASQARIKQLCKRAGIQPEVIMTLGFGVRYWPEESKIDPTP